MRNGRRSFRRARSPVRSERTEAFGEYSRRGKMNMVGGVEQLHGTRFEEMSSGCKAIYRRSSGQNLGAKGVIRCRRTDLGNEHLGISHRSNGIWCGWTKVRRNSKIQHIKVSRKLRKKWRELNWAHCLGRGMEDCDINRLVRRVKVVQIPEKTVVENLHRINKVVLSNHVKRVLFFGTKQFGLGIVGLKQFGINKPIQKNDGKRWRYFGTKNFFWGVTRSLARGRDGNILNWTGSRIIKKFLGWSVIESSG
jgi:hypothetical protein